ncbi:HAD family hydrolase [Streptomyces sp. NPDC007088]|uniref:HAD family hydrolase n=1 Tax=Streptomyces sp. NPDC007088 TaxID=3364773 RepID=UPI003675A45E
MTFKAVLFDFSGTLLRIESAESWLRGGLVASGTSVPEAEVSRLAAELELAGAQPGGRPGDPARLPAGLAALWAVRDESAAAHRAAYTGLARQVPLPREDLYDALYERHMTPAAWQPYPDAHEVLATLRARGLATGVVSNIGWDLRPVLRAHGLDALVDTYALSYEHGVQKPDARLFAAACQALGVAPGHTLMVGDDRQADGGAAALGCAVHYVEHLPVAARPAGLRPVLALVG